MLGVYFDSVSVFISFVFFWAGSGRHPAMNMYILHDIHARAAENGISSRELCIETKANKGLVVSFAHVLGDARTIRILEIGWYPFLPIGHTGFDLIYRAYF